MAKQRNWRTTRGPRRSSCSGHWSATSSKLQDNNSSPPVDSLHTGGRVRRQSDSTLGEGRFLEDYWTCWHSCRQRLYITPILRSLFTFCSDFVIWLQLVHSLQLCNWTINEPHLPVKKNAYVKRSRASDLAENVYLVLVRLQTAPPLFVWKLLHISLFHNRSKSSNWFSRYSLAKSVALFIPQKQKFYSYTISTIDLLFNRLYAIDAYTRHHGTMRYTR